MKTSPEFLGRAVMLYLRFPPVRRNGEDVLRERGIKISHETVRHLWNRCTGLPDFGKRLVVFHTDEGRPVSLRR